MTTSSPDPTDLLRRALKNHDAILAAQRSGLPSNRMFKAIDDMALVKEQARTLGAYPGSSDGPMLTRMAEHGIDGILTDDERKDLQTDLAALAEQRQRVEAESRDLPMGGAL